MKILNKKTMLLVSLVLLVGVSVASTLAFISTSAGPVENKFIPTSVPIKVVEDFNGNVKSNVQIQNDGNIDAYIRAAVVVTWQDTNGNVYGQAPKADTDYTITLSSDGWIVGKDGFYYYKSKVGAKGSSDPSDTTTILIKEATVKEGAAIPDGYQLSIEILAQSIQAQPDEAVEQAWTNAKVTVDADSGTLTVTNKGTNN